VRPFALALLGASATLSVTVMAAAVAVVLFAIFLLLASADPLSVYRDMYAGAFGSSFSIQNSLARSAPLMLTALCTALPARLGMIVIGNEGALLLGGLSAAAAAMALPDTLPPGFMLPCMLLAGSVVGGLWIALAGVLRQARGVNETISSLLLFYIGLALFLHLVEGPLRDPSSLNKPSTYPIGAANMLGNIPGVDVHWGFCFGLCACLLCHVLMAHTTYGFSARIVGGNLRAARGAGLPIGWLVFASCMLAGGAAGLAGAIEVVAIHGSANATLYAGLGFSGILVAFVARHHPLAIIAVAILLGGIEASGGVLQRRHDLPDAAVDVFKGLLFLVILASETYIGRLQAFVDGVVAAQSGRARQRLAAASVSPESTVRADIAVTGQVTSHE
jgi:general nucleoside transport system permease protein